MQTLASGLFQKPKRGKCDTLSYMVKAPGERKPRSTITQNTRDILTTMKGLAHTSAASGGASLVEQDTYRNAVRRYVSETPPQFLPIEYSAAQQKAIEVLQKLDPSAQDYVKKHHHIIRGLKPKDRQDVLNLFEVPQFSPQVARTQFDPTTGMISVFAPGKKEPVSMHSMKDALAQRVAKIAAETETLHGMEPWQSALAQALAEQSNVPQDEPASEVLPTTEAGTALEKALDERIADTHSQIESKGKFPRIRAAFAWYSKQPLWFRVPIGAAFGAGSAIGASFLSGGALTLGLLSVGLARGVGGAVGGAVGAYVAGKFFITKEYAEEHPYFAASMQAVFAVTGGVGLSLIVGDLAATEYVQGLLAHGHGAIAPHPALPPLNPEITHPIAPEQLPIGPTTPELGPTNPEPPSLVPNPEPAVPLHHIPSTEVITPPIIAGDESVAHLLQHAIDGSIHESWAAPLNEVLGTLPHNLQASFIDVFWKTLDMHPHLKEVLFATHGAEHWAWNAIPDGTAAHFDTVFAQPDFAERFVHVAQSSSPSYASLVREFGGVEGLKSALDQLAQHYH